MGMVPQLGYLCQGRALSAHSTPLFSSLFSDFFAFSMSSISSKEKMMLLPLFLVFSLLHALLPSFLSPVVCSLELEVCLSSISCCLLGVLTGVPASSRVNWGCRYLHLGLLGGWSDQSSRVNLGSSDDYMTLTGSTCVHSILRTTHGEKLLSSM